MIIFWCFLEITLIGNVYTQLPYVRQTAAYVAGLALPNYDKTETLKTSNYRIETYDDHIEITCQSITDLSNSVNSLEFFKSDVVVLSKSINLIGMDYLLIGNCSKVVIKSDLFKSEDSLTQLIIENVDVLKYKKIFGTVMRCIISPCISKSNKINELILRDIKKIPNNFLENFKNLKKLKYNQNSFKLLKSKPFKRLKKLRNLDLNNNYQMKLKTNLFTGLYYLHNLYISQNNLISLGDKVFIKLKKLMTLDLSYNKIEKITNETFEGLHKLEYLRLDHNKLTSLANRPFKFLYNLIILDLSYNEITKIDPNSFQLLRELKNLYLNDNHLTMFESKVFLNLWAIKVLKIYNNPFKNPNPKWFHHLPRKACIYFDTPDDCAQYSSIQRNGFLPKAIERIKELDD